MTARSITKKKTFSFLSGTPPLEKISKTHYEDERLPDDPRKSKLVEHIADHFVKEKCPDENEVLLAFIKALAGSVPKSVEDPATEETR